MENLSSFPRNDGNKPRQMKQPVPEDIYIDWGPELPADYGIDRITAMPCDPFSVYFYWELAGGRRNEVIAEKGERAFDGSMLLIKIFHVESKHSFEIFPHTPMGSWYFQALPNSTYRAVIGYLLSSDEFVVFAESNTVRTPPAGPGGRVSRTAEENLLAMELLGQVFQAGSSMLGITSPSRFNPPSSWGVKK